MRFVFWGMVWGAERHRPAPDKTAGRTARPTLATHAMKRELLPKETDDKEQLSPVAVMDFPFDDGGYDDTDDDVVEEEEGLDAGSTCLPSFTDSLALLQRRKKQLQHKIQRFGSSGELGPENLEARFAASDSGSLGGDDVLAVQLQLHQSVSVQADADECSLLYQLLLTTHAVSAAAAASGRLLLEFFAETTSRSEPLSQKPNLWRNSEAVRLATAWLEGTGSRWGLTDVLRRREDIVAEMERGRRWTLAGDEESEEVGAVVAGVVVDELVDELVRDLAV